MGTHNLSATTHAIFPRSLSKDLKGFGNISGVVNQTLISKGNAFLSTCPSPGAPVSFVHLRSKVNKWVLKDTPVGYLSAIYFIPFPHWIIIAFPQLPLQGKSLLSLSASLLRQGVRCSQEAALALNFIAGFPLYSQMEAFLPQNQDYRCENLKSFMIKKHKFPTVILGVTVLGAKAAITTYHKLGGMKNRKLFSHHFGA